MKQIEKIKECQNLKIQQFINRSDVVRIVGYYFDPVNSKKYLVMFTRSLGWEHASVSTPNKTPSWDIMCRVKDIFWTGEECCVEYHPKEEDYVNTHEHCLHIWKPIDEEIPTPPSIMVGFKDIDSKKAKEITNIFLGSLSKEELTNLAKSRGINVENRKK